MNNREQNSLKDDIVNPLKEFVEEVHNDTIGDAVKFYSNAARRAEKNAKAAKEKAKAKRERIRREQEELKKQRAKMMKRAAIVFAVIIVTALVAISVVLHVQMG